MAEHLISLADVSAQDLLDTLALARMIKAYPSRYQAACRGRTLALLLEQPSLRTRVSFTTGIFALGGQAVTCTGNDIPPHWDLAHPQTAAMLSQCADGVVLRTSNHTVLQAMAGASDVPVINGGTDQAHPCHILADLMTLQEQWGTLAGRTLVYTGAQRAMAHSLAWGCARVGINLRIVSATERPLHSPVIEQAQSQATGTISTHTQADLAVATQGADAIYTDAALAAAVSAANPSPQAALQDMPQTTLWLHRHPVQQTSHSKDSSPPQLTSMFTEQAANRIHVQKAVLVRHVGAIQR